MLSVHQYLVKARLLDKQQSRLNVDALTVEYCVKDCTTYSSRFFGVDNGMFCEIIYIWQPETCQNITIAILSREAW